MGTKVKGLLKGLKYISQIFDEEKEQDIQIGFPTDVKHVAHIGWDGPSAVDNPSWMKEFKAPGAFQSAPLAPPGDPKENPEIKWVSEDNNRRSRHAKSSQDKDLPDLPKSSRRHSSSENGGSDSPKKESTKVRRSRRQHSKDAADGSSSSRQLQMDSTAGSESPARNVPDIPRKSRRKKSKESNNGGSGSGSGSTRSSRSEGTHSAPATSVSDPGPDTGSDCSILSSRNNEFLQTSTLKPLEEER